ncbi:MAG: 3-hydroxyacyl-CoA dehydrogenase family protein, partial [Pseudomonadota bacterium]
MSNIAGRSGQQAAILGSGTMGGQIALSLALGGLKVSLWGRRATSLIEVQQRIETDLAYMIEVGLVSANPEEILDRIKTTEDLMEAVTNATFVLEAIVEDLSQKQQLLAQVEKHVSDTTILSSTTSALSATALQSALKHPERFAIAHYAQPGHLVRLVEVVPGKQTSEETTQFVIDLLQQCGKSPVPCPDIPGFLWARIQHAILREFVSLVGQGLVTPEVCDTVLKEGYAVRLPAMGCFEHADLAGLDLIDSEAARAVWADLSNVTSPADTMIGELKQSGQLGMRSGQGFYDWTVRDSEAFKRNRDEEIVRRMLIQAGGEVHPPQQN